MTIEEMHVMFREVAQQMGLQTVRAIFSENIDICLNNAIIAKTRNLLAENIGNIPTNKAKQIGVSPLNSLRTLYKEGIINADNINGEGTEINPFTFNIDTTEIMLITSFKLYYDTKLYECRIIENEELSDTLRDFCNRASKTYPIVTAFGTENEINIQLYNGNDKTKPKQIKYSYIKLPNTVVYDEEYGDNNINCDLPIYLHNDIVNDAVKYYLSSIGKN